MESRRQCSEVKSNEGKDEESDKDEEKEEEIGKDKEKERSDDPSNKEKLSLKETTPLRPKNVEEDKNIPPRFS